MATTACVTTTCIPVADVYDSVGVSHDLTNITLALRTLGTFDFEDHSLTKLLRHCADKFLGSDNEEVRLEAVKTCSSLLTYTSSVSTQDAESDAGSSTTSCHVTSNHMLRALHVLATHF